MTAPPPESNIFSRRVGSGFRASFVIPAKAGTQLQLPARTGAHRVPAFAGMTRMTESEALAEPVILAALLDDSGATMSCHVRPSPRTRCAPVPFGHYADLSVPCLAFLRGTGCALC